MRQARGIGSWALLLTLLAPTAFAQTETKPSEAAPRDATKPSPSTPASSTPSSSTPASSTPEQPPRSAALGPASPPIYDGLDVPPTLKPLVADPGTPSTLDTTMTSGPPPLPVHFGDRGQWVLMGSSNGLNLSNATFSGSSASDFHAGGGIGIDYFVVDDVSVGVDAEGSYRHYKSYGATTFAETTSTDVAGGIRFGANARLGESISWYPRLTLMLASSHSTVTPLATSNGDVAGAPVSQASVGPAMNFYAPLLLHPAAHFVLGFGPRIQHDFAITRGGPYDGAQATLISGQFTVGGWWGGETPDSPDGDRSDSPSQKKPGKPAELFGGSGQVVVTSATDVSLGHRAYSQSKGSETDLTLEPGVDYFVTESATIGAALLIGHSVGTGLDEAGAQTEYHSTNLGLVLRAGYNLRLSTIASIWLRGGVGYGSVDSSISSESGTNQHTRTRGWVDVSAPLLVHPVSHFFVGAGPFLFHELSDRDQYNHENNATKLGLNLVLGGWFGGPSGLATLVPAGT